MANVISRPHIVAKISPLPSLAALTLVGLGFACPMTSECLHAQTLRLDGLRNQTAAYQPGAGNDRLCNPAAEGTREDMKLAVAILRDTTETGIWANVASYLGKLGFRECFEPLREFIWRDHVHGDSALYMLDALMGAQQTMGHVAASNPEALHYLIRSTNPDFWETLPWHESRMTRAEFCLEMSNASISALGISGAPEAGQMLARLRQWPYREAQRPTIEEALRTHHRVTFWRPLFRDGYRPIPLPHLREMLPPSGDSSLVGAWRWERSVGFGAFFMPPPCGWARTLFLERDSTYSFWEEDSVGEYLISRGRFAVHKIVSGGRKGPWIELRDWTWEGPGSFWAYRSGPDFLHLTPGGADGVWHDRGLTHTFVREQGTAPHLTRAKEWRPVRICPSSDFPFFIELPQPLMTARSGMHVQPWQLSHRRELVPKGYEYTHYQIPSAVIGDFDGDSLADVAIYGYDEKYRNTVLCLLSNRGSPRGAVAWRGPAPSERKDGPAQPSFYLELCPSGREVAGPCGIRTRLATDAIYEIRAHGEKSVLYYENGEFRRGKPVSW